MKKLFFGLAVALIAFGASAFTNVKTESSSTRFTTIWVTGIVTEDDVDYYTYELDDPGLNCSASASPCQIANKPIYPLPAGKFPVSEYNSTNFLTTSRQSQL